MPIISIVVVLYWLPLMPSQKDKKQHSNRNIQFMLTPDRIAH